MKFKFLPVTLVTLLSVSLMAFSPVPVNKKKKKGKHYTRTSVREVSRTLYDKCNDEYVVLTGKVHSVTHVNTTNDFYNTFNKRTYNLQGVGQTSGKKYVANLSYHSSTKRYECEYTYKFSDDVRLITAGGDDNLVITNSETRDVDCDGNITSEVSMEVKCN